jgi:DnaJ homolog subfamily C member 8
MKEEEKTRQQISDYSREIDAIKYKSIKSKGLKADVEIDRLTNEKFYNPYDVLQLEPAATEDEIKKQYKAFAMILHPDKCKDPRAKDAWHAVEQAHKTLCDPDKRKVYLRIMHEARERTEFEREKENKRRAKNGQLSLPESTFQEQYQETCLNIFKDLEGKKDHIVKLQQSTYNRKMEELETKKIIEQFRVLTEEEWERSREKRVANWREFTNKKYVVGSKRSNGAIRPPPVKAEDRPHYSSIDDKKKNL